MQTGNESPELVLVAPLDVAAAARRALPERHWELFAPAAARRREPTAPRAAQLRTAPLRATRRSGRVRRTVVTTVAAALLVAASVEVSRRLNTITPASGETLRAAANAAPVQLSLPAAATVAAASLRGSAATRHAARKSGLAVDGGGYVLGGGGTLQVDRRGRSISLHVLTRCGGQLSLPRIPLTDGRRFAYTGTVGLAPRVRRVMLRGSFRSRSRARGWIRVSAGRCDTGVLPLTARLS
jgi:hypothetical protein